MWLMMDYVTRKRLTTWLKILAENIDDDVAYDI